MVVTDVGGSATLAGGFTYEDDAGPIFIRGNCNDDDRVDLSDAVCILTWLFLGGERPGCVSVTNTNGDGTTDLTDAVYLLTHLFLGGPAPPEPFPDCGPGGLPADEQMGCDLQPTSCP